jgi:hypothetical protein
VRRAGPYERWDHVPIEPIDALGLAQLDLIKVRVRERERVRVRVRE